MKIILKFFLILFALFIVFIFSGKIFLSEFWKASGRNKSKVERISLGDKFSTEFEKYSTYSSPDEKYIYLEFPLPSIMAHPDGSVIYRKNDSIVVQIRISESFQISPGFEKKWFPSDWNPVFSTVINSVK